MKELAQWKAQLRMIGAEFLHENKAQAEKLLKANNIPLDDSSYIALKDKLTSANALGYLGPFVRLALQDGPQRFGYIALQLEDIWELYRDYFKQLPKPLDQIQSYEELEHMLDRLERMRIIKKFTERIRHKVVKQEAADLLIGMDTSKWEEWRNKLILLEKMDPALRTEFTKKMDRFHNAKDLLSALEIHIRKAQSGMTFQNVLQKLRSIQGVTVLYENEETEQILAQIHTFEASQAVGSTSWCIVGEEHQWRTYVERNGNFQYFFWDMEEKRENLIMVAFTMDKMNKITAAHDRYDAELPDVKNHLKRRGILPTVYELNQRQRMQQGMKSLNQVLNFASLYKEPNETITIAHESMNRAYTMGAANFLETYQQQQGRGNMDELFKGFQRMNTKFIQRSYQGQLETEKSLNITVFVLTNFDQVNQKYSEGAYVSNDDLYNEDFVTPKAVNVKEFTERVLKLYQSNNNLSTDTRRAMLQYLKDHGVDPLALTRATKAKHGQDLSDTEFSVSAHRGNNMQPYVQNKLAAWRKGEDVNFNPSEIKYAIDNGYGDFFKEQYNNMLDDPDFKVDYDTMQILQKLGLMPKAEKVIANKAENMGYGENGLNSIERSIYQHYKHRAGASV